MNPKLMCFILGIMLICGTAFAQRTVTGLVTDEQNEPLIGVNILIQGTTTGTISDVNGNYSLDVPDSDDVTLVYSSIGYITRTEVLGSRSVLNLVLAEDIEQLEEVVVSALGFKEQRDEMGSTYSQVNTEDLSLIHI